MAITYTGRGNRILTIALPDPTQATLMVVTNRGTDGNVTVYELDDQLHEADLAVNTIGQDTGTVLVNKQGKGTTLMKIDGAGTWTITPRSVSTARHFSSVITGKTEDDVVVHTGPAGIFNFSNKGSDSNVTIYSYDQDGNSDLLVNEIGAVTTQTAIHDGPQVLEINGTGTYAIAVTPA